MTTKDEAELRKIIAEAKLAEVTAERDRLEADLCARKLHAEAELEEYKAEQAKIERDCLAIEYIHKAREERFAQAHPDMTGRFTMTTKVDENTVGNVRSKILSFAHRNPGANIELSFCSPGGSVFDGYHLYGTLKHLSAQGHHITTVASGVAASMAAVLLQAGDHRVLASNGLILIHEPSSLAIGKAGEIKEKAKFMENITMQMCEIFEERSNGRLTSQDVFEKIEHKDWWIWPDDAISYGLVDEVRPG